MHLISAQNCLLNIQEHSWVLVDIREDYELELVPCELAVHMVMGEILQHLDYFEANKHYVFMCKTGKRAGSLAQLLATKIKNTAFYAVDGGVYELLRAQDIYFDEY